MNLQREISSSEIYCPECGSGTNVKFTDVCLNPLSDPDDPSKGGCAIFSTFEYWENDWERIVKNHTYFPNRNDKTEIIITTYKAGILVSFLEEITLRSDQFLI
jgi:hypothetical protein